MPQRVICGVGIEMEMSVNARARERTAATGRRRELYQPPEMARTDGADAGRCEAKIERGIGEISEP